MKVFFLNYLFMFFFFLLLDAQNVSSFEHLASSLSLSRMGNRTKQSLWRDLHSHRHFFLFSFSTRSSQLGRFFLLYTKTFFNNTTNNVNKENLIIGKLLRLSCDDLICTQIVVNIFFFCYKTFTFPFYLKNLFV